MRRPCLIPSITLALLLGSAATSAAWDTYYDGSQLPTEEGWTSSGDMSLCSTSGGVLGISDDSTDASVYFRRTVSSYGQPITAEARLRVYSSNGVDSPNVQVSNSKVTTMFAAYPNELRVRFGWVGSWLSFPVDFSAFHTIRVATDSQANSYVWLDRALIANGVAGSDQSSMGFGAPYFGATSHSEWDYVAASPEFLPIPEPSSLLALAGGLAALGFPLIWRRRR